MSNESVTRFWLAAQQNGELRKKLLSVDSGMPLENAIGAIVQIGAEAGFVFTAEEYREAVRTHLVHTFKKDASEELNEDALSEVTGGLGALTFSHNPAALGYGFGPGFTRFD